MKRIVMTLACLLVWTFAVPMGWAQKSDDAEHAELAKALRDAKISLQRGLASSTKEGSRFRRSMRWSTESFSCPSTR